MGKNLSVDELLAEYNKQLDSFDANSLLEESRKAKYLEQAQAELEKAERERLEREKQDQAEQMLSEQSEAGMTQAEQAENEFEDIPPFEPEQPVYEQPQPVYEQQPSVQQYPSRQVEQTVEFDSQPVQWIPQEQPQQEQPQQQQNQWYDPIYTYDEEATSPYVEPEHLAELPAVSPSQVQEATSVAIPVVAVSDASMFSGIVMWLCVALGIAVVVGVLVSRRTRRG